jgi:hypothetical protein
VTFSRAAGFYRASLIGLRSNNRGLLVPVAVFAVTLASPVWALELILNVAAIPVVLDTTLLTVMPGIGRIDAPARLSPLMNT